MPLSVTAQTGFAGELLYEWSTKSALICWAKSGLPMPRAKIAFKAPSRERLEYDAGNPE
jgi:hypothetical protein